MPHADPLEQTQMIRFGDAARPDSLKEQRMSALGQKRTFAVQKKACPLYPRKETLQSIYSDSRHSSHKCVSL